MYWKGCPVTTRTVEDDDVSVDEFLGPLAQAFKFIETGDEAGLRKLVESQKVEADALVKDEKAAKKAVAGTSDLRRYTVNVAPALARAMSLLLDQGVEKEKVRDLMVSAAPLVAAEFERVTGRKVIGVSVHFDSNLPHWNLWHSGLEPVIYKVGKSERTRFRRTAMDLNASGNMLAWDRVSRAFARMGEDFSEVSLATAAQLKKAEERAQKRQGRPPGDFTINRKADEVVGTALKELGYGELIDCGYREFVENEKKRYAAAIAGRDGKDLKMIIDLLPKQPGESPLEATRRLVDERAKIETTLETVHTDGEKENLVSAITNLVETVTAAQSNEERMREALQAAGGETLADAAALRAERDGLKVQVGESATVLSQVKSVLKSDSDEPLLEAAKRVTAGAEEAEALKSRVEEMEAEGKKLRGERDDLKSQVAKGVKTLEKVKTTIALEPGKDLIPALERTVNEAASVHALMQQAGKLQGELASSCASLQQEQEKVRRLEEEIGPFRILWPLVEKLLELLNKSPLVQKLDAKIKALLHEIGNHVKVPFNPEIKQKPSLETEQEM